MEHGSISTEQCSISTEQGSIFTDQGSILCRRVPFIFIGQGFHFYGKGFHFNGSGFHFYGEGFHLYGEGSILTEYGSMFTGQPHVTITNNHRAGPSARPEHACSCYRENSIVPIVVRGLFFLARIFLNFPGWLFKLARFFWNPARFLSDM
mgnify:CR=1 FL=1